MSLAQGDMQRNVTWFGKDDLTCRTAENGSNKVIFDVSGFSQARTPADSGATGVSSNWRFLLYQPSLPIHIVSCHIFYTEDFLNFILPL